MKRKFTVFVTALVVYSFLGCSTTNTTTTSNNAANSRANSAANTALSNATLTANQPSASVNTNAQSISPLASVTINEGVYFIPSAFRPAYCVDIGSENVHDNDDNLHRFNCNGAVYQKWRIRRDPEREGRYLIEWSGAGNKFWGVEDHSNDDGAYVLWERRDNTAYQSWRIDDMGSGNYRFANDGSGKCLDYWSDDADGKANLRLVPCSNPPQQLWKLQPTS